MSNSTITVSRITEKDIPDAITTIQDAFGEDDPFFCWVYDRPNFSHSRNRASLGIRLNWGIKNGQIFVAHTAERRCAGVAMWVAPKSSSQVQSWGEWWQDWLLWFRQVGMNTRFGRGGLKVNRYWIWKESQTKMQDEIFATIPEGVWFCNVLAVHSDSQGKKIGKTLMNEIHDVADRENKKCYLESSKAEPNMKIYEKMGYHFVKEMKCSEGEGENSTCTLFCMIRDPQTPDGTKKTI